MRVRRPGRLDDPRSGNAQIRSLPRSIGRAIGDILGNRGGEERGLLRDEAEVPPEGFEVQRLDVVAVVVGGWFWGG